MGRFKFEIGQVVEVVEGSDTGKLVKILNRSIEAQEIYEEWDGVPCWRLTGNMENWYTVLYLDDPMFTAEFVESWLRRYVKQWTDWSISETDLDSESKMFSSSHTDHESTGQRMTSLITTTSL